jgi:uncharacterized membrane protein
MKSSNIAFLIALNIFIIFLFMPVACVAAPFNLDIDLPDTYKNVNPGAEVWFTIKLLNLANTDRIDVTLKYDLIDENSNVLVTKTKTVAIETQASFVADLKVPDKTKPGNYYVLVNMDSPLGNSSSKASFKVVTSKSNMLLYYYITGLIILILIIFFIIRSKPLIQKLVLRFKIQSIVNSKMKKK